MTGARLLVCGGRNFRGLVQECDAYDALDQIRTDRGVGVVITGGCRGADVIAQHWARDRGIPTLTFFADWRAHGRVAGPIRNQAMIDDGKPDLVVAFPGGAGTADMVRRAEAAGLTVVRVDGDANA